MQLRSRFKEMQVKYLSVCYTCRVPYLCIGWYDSSKNGRQGQYVTQTISESNVEYSEYGFRVISHSYTRGAEIPDASSPGRLNFVRWRLTLVKFSVCYLLHTILLAPRVLRCFLAFLFLGGGDLCTPDLHN